MNDVEGGFDNGDGFGRLYVNALEGSHLDVVILLHVYPLYPYQICLCVKINGLLILDQDKLGCIDLQ